MKNFKNDLLSKNISQLNLEGQPVKEGMKPLAKTYEDKFNQIVPDIDELSTSQEIFLINTFDTLYAISNQLKPFNNMGVSYSLSLAGGAVRDFLLDRVETIADLDVYLFLGNNNIDEFSRTSGVKNLVVLEELAAQKITGDNYPIILRKDEDYLDYAISSLMKKEFDISNSFHKTHVSREYLEAAIKSIFKMQSRKKHNLQALNNIDLIITQSPIADFVLLFDFEICKTYIDFRPNRFKNIHDELKNENNFLSNLNSFSDKQKIEHMYSSIIMEHSCLKDMVDKTLTINLNKFPKEHIDYFLEKHYLKLLDKFPTYEFKTQDIVMKQNPENSEVFRKALNLRLNKVLPENINQVKRPKI